MLTYAQTGPLGQVPPGDQIGASRYVAVDQAMINAFGAATLDPDPMHIDPDWAQNNGPFDGAIAFGFLTVSLLTHLLRDVLGEDMDRQSAAEGYYLNYGFNRLRLITPVPAGARVRGRFILLDREIDEKQRLLNRIEARIEIDGEERPALVGEWLTMWVPPQAA